jgi:hypothetical protein
MTGVRIGRLRFRTNNTVIVGYLSLCLVLFWLAHRKGYNGAYWAFALFPVGLVTLVLLLPYVNDKSDLEEEEREKQRIRGHRIGLVLSTITLFSLFGQFLMTLVYGTWIFLVG